MRRGSSAGLLSGLFSGAPCSGHVPQYSTGDANGPGGSQTDFRDPGVFAVDPDMAPPPLPLLGTATSASAAGAGCRREAGHVGATSSSSSSCRSLPTQAASAPRAPAGAAAWNRTLSSLSRGSRSNSTSSLLDPGVPPLREPAGSVGSVGSVPRRGPPLHTGGEGRRALGLSVGDLPFEVERLRAALEAARVELASERARRTKEAAAEAERTSTAEAELARLRSECKKQCHQEFGVESAEQDQQQQRDDALLKSLTARCQAYEEHVGAYEFLAHAGKERMAALQRRVPDLEQRVREAQADNDRIREENERLWVALDMARRFAPLEGAEAELAPSESSLSLELSDAQKRSRDLENENEVLRLEMRELEARARLRNRPNKITSEPSFDWGSDLASSRLSERGTIDDPVATRENLPPPANRAARAESTEVPKRAGVLGSATRENLPPPVNIAARVESTEVPKRAGVLGSAVAKPRWRAFDPRRARVAGGDVGRDERGGGRSRVEAEVDMTSPYLLCDLQQEDLSQAPAVAVRSTGRQVLRPLNEWPASWPAPPPRKAEAVD